MFMAEEAFDHIGRAFDVEGMAFALDAVARDRAGDEFGA